MKGAINMTTEEKERIKELRLKGMGYKAIASITGLSRDSVRGFCRRNGLIGVSAVVALNLEEKIKKNELCIYCEKPIKQKLQGRARKFCADECRYKWWNENLDIGNINQYFKNLILFYYKKIFVIIYMRFKKSISIKV